jgi:hypothetical protein
MGISPIRTVMEPANSARAEADRVMQMLFYEPSLGKVGNGWRVTKVSLYHGTNCYAPFSLEPAEWGRPSPSVRYVTDARALLG